MEGKKSNDREGLLRKEMTKANNDKKLLAAHVPLMISAAVCNSLAAAVASAKRSLRDVVAGLIFKKDDGSRNSSYSNYMQSSRDRMQDRLDATKRGDIYDLNDEVDLFEVYGLRKTPIFIGVEEAAECLRNGFGRLAEASPFLPYAGKIEDDHTSIGVDLLDDLVTDSNMATQVRALNSDFNPESILKDGEKTSLLIRRAALFLDHTDRFSIEAREGMHGLIESACQGLGEGDSGWSNEQHHSAAMVRWRIFVELWDEIRHAAMCRDGNFGERSYPIFVAVLKKAEERNQGTLNIVSVSMRIARSHLVLQWSMLHTEVPKSLVERLGMKRVASRREQPSSKMAKAVTFRSEEHKQICINFLSKSGCKGVCKRIHPTIVPPPRREEMDSVEWKGVRREIALRSKDPRNKALVDSMPDWLFSKDSDK